MSVRVEVEFNGVRVPLLLGDDAVAILAAAVGATSLQSRRGSRSPRQPNTPA
jgi:hypothetical protein